MQIHPFEEAGLGKAPFRCTGVSENYIRHPDGHTQAAGCCHYCGTGIRWEYHVQSSDGASFVVGADCIAKVGDVADFDSARLKSAKERRQQTVAARREAKLAAEREARLARLVEIRESGREISAEWWRKESDLGVRLKTSVFEDGSFLAAMQRELIDIDHLTPRQTEAAKASLAAIDRMARIEAEKCEARKRSTHVGIVGTKLRDRLTVTFARLVGYNRKYYPPAPRIMIKLKDRAGNNFVWWTSKMMPIGAEMDTCTITGHGDHDGIKQTIVNRVSASRALQDEKRTDFISHFPEAAEMASKWYDDQDEYQRLHPNAELIRLFRNELTEPSKLTEPSNMSNNSFG